MTDFERRAPIVYRLGALTDIRGGDGDQRRGVTLIEMLVAMAISLIMMAAVVNLFAVMTSSVSASRASIGLSEALRSTRNRLQADLAGATAPMLPPLRPENGDGYFEYFEGPSSDSTAYGTAYHNSAGTGHDTITGDPDDVLMFTTRSKDGLPFVGKFYNTSSGQTLTVESQTAEVVWFTIPNGRTVPLADLNGIPLLDVNNNLAQVQLFTLYRRLLVVAPEFNNTVAAGVVGSAFFNEYDVSAHYVAASNAMVLNSLSDLTKRENRFAHDPTAFPYPVFLPPSGASFPTAMQSLQPFPATAPAGNAGEVSRVGEDVVLTNVLSFDVKAFDPSMPMLYMMNAAGSGPDLSTGLVPSDIGYWTSFNSYTSWSGSGTNPWLAGTGGFVDLGYAFEAGKAANSVLAGGLAPMPGYSNPNTPSNHFLTQWGNGAPTNNSYNTLVNFPTYDTWSLHYEATAGANPGTVYRNFNSGGTVINGTNGFDDDGINGVDDPGEFQFPPPYSAPLRGIQVKIRTYEPDSRQVREVTIVQDFVPQ